MGSYIGRTAREIYQDRPDILEQIFVCFRERSTSLKEMSYTIPNTNESYSLRVYYVYLPPNRVMVITEDNTEPVRVRKEIERRANEFYALYENSQILGSQFDLSALLEVIVDRAIALLNRYEGGLFFFDSEHKDLPVAVWHGPPIPPNTRLAVGESVAGQVALTKQPIIVNDYSHWEHSSSQFDWLKLKAVIGVPLLFSGELIGVLVVFERDVAERGFTQSDIHLLSLFASQAAAAIRNVSMHEEMRHRIIELEAVNTISKSVRQADSLNDMLAILLKETLKVMGTEAGIIWLYEPHKSELVSIVARGWCKNLAAEPVPTNEGIAGYLFIKGEPYFSREFRWDLETKDINHHKIPAGWGGACLPIRTAHGVVGVMIVSVQLPREIKGEEMHLLTTLSEIAGNAIHRMQLHANTRQQAEELALAYDTTLEGWARALELRDKETEGHSRRVVNLAENLARRLGLPEEKIVHLRRGVLLHDIGKMGIPDHILLKPGLLTEEEWEIMKQHPQYAFNMISSIDFLQPALEIPYCHHERWNGTGYPRGLKGEEIPIGARIFAVVDVWDALRSDRPYRQSWSRSKARRYIRSQAEHAFDPKIVDAFLKMIKTIDQ
ncbi:MAG TPA: HD domain-containing phosphohydrolase [Anaerolineales bacterium]|nr:HD domain-containing phosphohydrolase [Anaerolineales bacterium]